MNQKKRSKLALQNILIQNGKKTNPNQAIRKVFWGTKWFLKCINSWFFNKFLERVLSNITPVFELNSISRGKKQLLYPVLIKKARTHRLAIRFLKKAIYLKKPNFVYKNLFFILININQKSGEAYTKFIGNTKLVEKHRVFLK